MNCLIPGHFSDPVFRPLFDENELVGGAWGREKVRLKVQEQRGGMYAEEVLLERMADVKAKFNLGPIFRPFCCGFCSGQEGVVADAKVWS